MTPSVTPAPKQTVSWASVDATYRLVPPTLRKKLIKSLSTHCWSMLRLSGIHTHRKTLPRSKQSRGKRHASSSAGLGTPRVSTTCWRHWAGLCWSNNARLVDCWCSTKSKVALHIASPWKPNWSPSHHVSDAPMTNSSPCWPPETSIEAPPSSQKPSGTGTRYPWK